MKGKITVWRDSDIICISVMGLWIVSMIPLNVMDDAPVEIFWLKALLHADGLVYEGIIRPLCCWIVKYSIC